MGPVQANFGMAIRDICFITVTKSLIDMTVTSIQNVYLAAIHVYHTLLMHYIFFNSDINELLDYMLSTKCKIAETIATGNELKIHATPSHQLTFLNALSVSFLNMWLTAEFHDLFDSLAEVGKVYLAITFSVQYGDNIVECLKTNTVWLLQMVQHGTTVVSHELHGISNHWQFDCAFNSLIGLRNEENMKGLHLLSLNKMQRESTCDHWSKGLILWNMMTSSNGNIFRVTGPLCGEFTSPGEFPTQRPVMWSFDVFFDLHLNKWLSKQQWVRLVIWDAIVVIMTSMLWSTAMSWRHQGSLKVS